MKTRLKEVHRIQRSFRAVMDAMARPGTVRTMELGGAGTTSELDAALGSSLATLAGIFIDQATSFAVVGPTAEHEVLTVAAETHARVVPMDEAAFLIIPPACPTLLASEAFAAAAGGSLVSPETGATVLIACEHLASLRVGEAPFEAADLQWVSVEGPGVQGSQVFGVDRVDWAWARNRRDDEFPCGIDIVLADRDGHVVALPRTSFVSLLAVEKKVV